MLHCYPTCAKDSLPSKFFQVQIITWCDEIAHTIKPMIKWGKTGPLYIQLGSCLLENIQGKFPKNCSPAFISEESPFSLSSR